MVQACIKNEKKKICIWARSAIINECMKPRGNCMKATYENVYFYKLF